MKRFSLIICLILILSLSRVASAQIVLGPQAARGVGHKIIVKKGATITDTYFFTGPYVGNPSFVDLPLYKQYYLQVAVQFNLQGGTTTLPDMTSNNFTARLNGLTATDSWGTGSLNVYLYDMGDGTEDGNVYYNDFNSTQGPFIESRTHVIGGAPAIFDNVDVTEELRRDLFDLDGSNEDFSGFILLCPDAPAPEQHVRFNLVAPTLKICIDKDIDLWCIPEDCDDNDDLVNPDAAEVCDDGIDNNCDGLVDCYDTDDCGTVAACTDCTDEDGDGYYDDNIDDVCSGKNDCNDSDGSINPGATEICDDTIDNDCNGDIDLADAYCSDDKDGDDYTPSENDCNDNDASINPGVKEVCDDGIDNNCNGKIDSADSKCSDTEDSTCFISTAAR